MNSTIPIHCSTCGSVENVNEYLIKKYMSIDYPGTTEKYIYENHKDKLYRECGHAFINLCVSCKQHFDRVAMNRTNEQNDSNIKKVPNRPKDKKETVFEDISDTSIENDKCNDDESTINHPVEIHSTCQKCRTSDPKAMILCRDLDIDFFGVKHVDLCDKCFKQIERDIKESKETYFFKRLPNCKTSALAAALSNALHTHHFFGSDYDPELFILDEDENLPSTCLYNPMNIKV